VALEIKTDRQRVRGDCHHQLEIYSQRSSRLFAYLNSLQRASKHLGVVLVHPVQYTRSNR
jgi:hypothetical protein